VLSAQEGLVLIDSLTEYLERFNGRLVCPFEDVLGSRSDSIVCRTYSHCRHSVASLASANRAPFSNKTTQSLLQLGTSEDCLAVYAAPVLFSRTLLLSVIISDGDVIGCRV
jgi:hypothetical protein